MVKLNKYRKNFEKNGISLKSQEKLFASKVLVLGAGGLGCGVIANLVALGIGQIRVIDGAIIQEEDFNCPIIHKYRNFGRAKVISVKDWVLEHNPDVKVELDKVYLDKNNYQGVISDYDILVDCFDDLESKYLLNEIAFKHKKILIHGQTKGFFGQVTTFVPKKTACFNCLTQKPPLIEQEKYSTLSSVVNVTSSLQAQEVLKVITGYGEPLLNKLLIFDGLKSEFKAIPYSKNPICRCCSIYG